MALPAGESTVLRYQREKRPKSGRNNARGAQRIEQAVQRCGDFFCCGTVWGCEVGNGTSHRYWACCARRAGSSCCACGSGGTICARGPCRARGSGIAFLAGGTHCAGRTGSTIGTRCSCGTGGTIRACGASRTGGTIRTGRTGSACCTCGTCGAGRAVSTCCARGTCSAGYAGRTCCTGRARGSIRAGCASWANASGGTGRTCCTGRPSRAAGRTGRARGTGRTSRTRRSRRTCGSSSTSGTLRSHQSHRPHGSLRSGWPCRAGWACGTYRAGNGAAGRNAAVSPTVGRALIHFHSKNHPSVVVWSGFRVFDARRAVARTGRV